MFVFEQQFWKYTPLPVVKWTEPLPFTTSAPVKPLGPMLGVTTAPFEVPAASLLMPCNRKWRSGEAPTVSAIVLLEVAVPIAAEIVAL